jgi:Arc/MetJ family transcription regulator
MDFRMKTTLNIDDTVMAELKREAARQGRTMSELVETALRLLLRSQRNAAQSPPCQRSAAGAHWWILPTATRFTKPWKVANCLQGRRKLESPGRKRISRALEGGNTQQLDEAVGC